VPNPKAIGETTEAVILAHLIQRGDGVSLPFGNNQRYDMIVDRGGVLMKAQCKTGRLRRGVVRFPVHSINGFTGACTSYRGQVDVFLVWCPELGKVYEIPVDTVGTGWASLRVRPCRQRTKVRQAVDYELK
jgi:PD-(D/E)XK nuclease superfamily protein